MLAAFPRYRPYRDAGAIFQIGLKPMIESEWLDTGPDHAEFMAAKRERLRGRPPLYYRSLPDSLDIQSELRDRVVSHLLAHHGDSFALDGGRMTDRGDGSTHDLMASGMEPLEVAANFVEEDFILFERRGDADIIVAASNAYTSSGRIVSCVGRDMRYAHDPVPGLNEQLASRIDRVIAKIRKDGPVVRFNWFITAIADRLFPVGWHDANVAAAEKLAASLDEDFRICGHSLWLRVERQTFLRLPRTGALAFGIHTYSDPLSSIAGDAGSVQALRGLIADYSEERLRYGAMWAIRKPLLQWFDSQLE